MTQVSWYGHMLKLQIDRARMEVVARYRVEGSVLNDSVQADMLGVQTRLELESPAPPDTVARLVQTAERGCFVMQALIKPVPVTAVTVLNGQPLDVPPAAAGGTIRQKEGVEP